MFQINYPRLADSTASAIWGVSWAMTRDTILEASSPEDSVSLLSLMLLESEDDVKNCPPDDDDDEPPWLLEKLNLLSDRLFELRELNSNPPVNDEVDPCCDPPVNDEVELILLASNDEEDDPTADCTASATWGWIAARICWMRAELERDDDCWELNDEEREELVCDDDDDELDTESRVVAFWTWDCQISCRE